MFPLFGQTFGVDVWIPHHQRCDERIRHFATGQGYVLESFVTEISLSDIERVAVLRERTARGFVAEGYVR